ncbi:hypothetical protein Misp01_50710 [Microtetraspora sp. NBRC 13810]|uniref:class I SAM-dependent methyltransferase n=1 Tax=Microtetraspora sp. NBRC 13810 TaxID=3030990 RepID=UPI0024A27E3B|nr:class I SAM-dependent methyltransferase [Microtetraspora sp. NBRC 13810]GLW09942.1 hypothetical protein Misp01_50710 [Microtetraspora sp. NBRC 13810]
MERIRIRTPSTRRLLLVSAFAGGLGVAGLAALSAVEAIDWPDAVQLAVSTATLAAVAMTVLTVRRVDGKALRTDRRVKREEAALAGLAGELKGLVAAVAAQTESLAGEGRGHAETVVAALGEDRAELAAHSATLAEHTATLSAHGDRLGEIRSALARIEALTKDKVLPEVRSRGDFGQVEALVDLRALLSPRAPMPRLRGWAASPDVLRLLVERVAIDRPKLIVECGSGASTVWLGYAVERFGGGRVVALEHDERYARASRDLITAHGLESVVEVRHAPLTDWRSFPWYDQAALDDLSDIGLLFIDGPPMNTGHQARYPAVPLLLPRCAADALIVLDDARRAEEREVADRWLREFPELDGRPFPAEKGAMLFQRSAP